MRAFFDQNIGLGEARHHDELHQWRKVDTAWAPMTRIDELKPKARTAGLSNFVLPHSHRAPGGLSTLDYATWCAQMGRVMWSAEVFNCNAHDTGNMETIEHYGSVAQQNQWLEPLQRAEIRSAFLMTEPAVASSDATNSQCRIERRGDHAVINGRKWWSSGAGVSHCAAERALEMMMCKRLQGRIGFGKPLSQQSVWAERIAERRCRIDQASLLTLNAAHRMDTVRNKLTKAEIAMIKLVSPNKRCKVLDWAIQAFGAAGVSQDTWLVEADAHQRSVRLVHGPDEVHRNAIAKIALGKYAPARPCAPATSAADLSVDLQQRHRAPRMVGQGSHLGRKGSGLADGGAGRGDRLEAVTDAFGLHG